MFKDKGLELMCSGVEGFRASGPARAERDRERGRERETQTETDRRDRQKEREREREKWGARERESERTRKGGKEGQRERALASACCPCKPPNPTREFELLCWMAV